MRVEVINGLLGVGKTTFLLSLLEQKDPGEKTAVLVNEFGEIGIDGDILSGQGADVVELPNGCICCSLNSDLRNQIRFIAETFNPDRLIIEPTGIATIKNIMGVLKSLSLERYIEDVGVTVVLDAAGFSEISSQNPGFVANQVKSANRVIINKCDLAAAGEIENITNYVRNINPSARILRAIYGKITDDDYTPEELAGNIRVPGDHDHPDLDHDHPDLDHDHPDHGHEHEIPLKKFEQFSGSSKGNFDLEKLRRFFKKVQKGKFGPVDRAKGIFLSDSAQWVRIDLASREIAEAVVNGNYQLSKVIVIGTDLHKNKLKEEFKKCLSVKTEE